MSVKIERFITGPIETNSYVVHGKGVNALLIDPSSGCEDALAFIRDNELALGAVLLTHGHFDHIMGIDQAFESFGEIPVWAHPDEEILLRNAEYNGSPMLGVQYKFAGKFESFSEGAQQIAGYALTVLHIPGHSPGGCAFLFDGICMSGDSLFAGSIGRTDFPGCDASALIRNLKEKLMTLSDETVVYPGHGGRTTIGRERRLNPFLQ